jgi:hypothetical protein
MTSPVPDQTPENQPAQPREQGFRSRIVTIAIAAVVLVGAAGSVWWFSGRNNNQTNQGAAARPVSTPRRTTPKPKPTPDNSAYTVGTCLSEPNDPNTGLLQMKPVLCAGQQAVLVINQVVHEYGDCQQDADYVNHGFILSDEVANVDYCASLVVPANQCFAFSTDNSKPLQRAACGSAANVVRVESVESATSVTDACKDQTTPDIWYYQSATSGQFACVTPLPPDTSSSNAPSNAPPTSSSTPSTGALPPE